MPEPQSPVSHQSKTSPLRGGWTLSTTFGQMVSPQPEGDLQDHSHVIHLTSTHSSYLTLFTSVAPNTGVAPPTFRFSPTLLPLPLFCHSHSSSVPRAFLFSPSSYSLVLLFFHHKKERPPRLSVSLLLHLFSLLIRAEIEPHPGPEQDPCSVCGSRVYAG